MNHLPHKYIIIRNLSNPQKAFERLENEFIDIMYPDSINQAGLVMLLDVNLDSGKDEDIEWLTELLNPVLLGIGEEEYYLSAYNP